MTSQIIIGVGGLLLSVLTYFAGVRRTEKRYTSIDKSKRMDAVFDRYMGFRSTNKTGGYDGLQKAGVATLESDVEVRELIDRIIAHGESNPLGSSTELFENVDLKLLFGFAVKNRINFFKTGIEEVIEKSQA